MNTEHTPGPWHVDYAQGIMTQDGAPIAYVCDDYSDAPSPDARLIAAAPDLLAALKAIEGCNVWLPFGLLAQTRAAIAKAEGKAQHSKP